MAGASYDLSTNAKLDLGYRYINLGSGGAAMTGLALVPWFLFLVATSITNAETPLLR